jgi:hypothetical protein
MHGQRREAVVFSASTSDVSQTPKESNGQRRYVNAAAGEGGMHFLPTRGLLKYSREVDSYVYDLFTGGISTRRKNITSHDPGIFMSLLSDFIIYM